MNKQQIIAHCAREWVTGFEGVTEEYVKALADVDNPDQYLLKAFLLAAASVPFNAWDQIPEDINVEVLDREGYDCFSFGDFYHISREPSMGVHEIKLDGVRMLYVVCDNGMPPNGLFCHFCFGIKE